MTWTVDSSALTWIVIISVSAGFLVGLAMTLLLRSNNTSRPPNKELMEEGHLWRSKADGSLWLQLDEHNGNRLEAFDGESQDKARKIIRELAVWTGKPVVPATASRLKAISKAEHSESEPGTQNPASPVDAPATAWSQPPLEAAAREEPALGSESSERPRIDIVKGIRLAMEGSSSKQEASIAAQVDAILQEKLKGTDLELRGIRLMELPGRGMVVLIGLEQYDTVDDVPFPDIKATLKSAVAEWEKQMSG